MHCKQPGEVVMELDSDDDQWRKHAPTATKNRRGVSQAASPTTCLPRFQCRNWQSFCTGLQSAPP
eukprot:5052006-Lingulodinium_polyedra.AAC.1